MSKELSILKDINDFQGISSSETNNHTHSIHPYPAKFIPQIPSRIIEEFSNERHTVLDPFSGSGTTLLEAKIKGRNSIGFDINPIGVLTSRVKSHYYSSEQFELIDSILEIILKRETQNIKKKLWIPEIPRIEHWFKEEVIKALSIIVDEIRKIKDIDVQRFFNLCLSGIIVSVSNQESETRFAAKQNNISFQSVFTSFKKKVVQNKEKLEELSLNEKFKKSTCKIFLTDTRNISQKLSSNSVDLVVTSPPYVNSFDYYLYHKFRIFWLNYPENKEVIDVSEVQKKELGSRYKFSGRNGSGVIVFKKEMIECFRNVHEVTKPGKMIFIVVGDSIVKGEFIKMDEFYKDVCSEAGMNFVGITSYQMKNASRSFVSQNSKNKHFDKKHTHVLAFINGSKIKNGKTPNSIEETIINKIDYLEVQDIPINIKDKTSIIIKSDKVVEYTHGLLKYPAKYIPHIPRWAILKYSNEGDTIMDNFMGSGTTNLEAVLLNRKSVGIDINPLSALISKVKTTPIKVSELESAFQIILNKYPKVKLKEADKVNFPLKEFWFPENELNDFFKLRKVVNEELIGDVKEFFQIVLYSIIKKFSYLDESQLKVKRDHQKLVNGVKDTGVLFENQASKSMKAMQSFVERIEFLNLKPSVDCNVLSATDKLPNYLNKIDLVVSSPPYINAMNYPMFHRYELLLSGLIDPDDYIDHQTDYLGTERVYSKQYNDLHLFKMEGNDFKDLNDKISQIYLKEKKRAFIVKHYFEGMKESIQKVYDYLMENGVYVIVCGTNQIKGVEIDTCSTLGEIGVQIGFKKELEYTYKIQKHRFKITRHSTGKKINEDKIIVLRK